MQVFRIAVLGLIALLPSSPSYADQAGPAVPNIAFYAFTPAIQNSRWVMVAANLSEMLSIQLGKSDKLKLLDRSLILDVFGEKALPLQQPSPNSGNLALDKIPASQYIVTGTLLNADRASSVALKVIDSDTGRIIGSTRRLYSMGDIPMLVEQLDRFIHSVIGNSNLAREENKTKRTIGIGNFINISRNRLGAGRGAEVREYLINHYLDKTGFDVLNRSRVYPLVLEAHLKRLQYANETRRLDRPTTPLYVHGRYQLSEHGSNTRIILYLYLDLIGSRRVSRTITGATWRDIYRTLDSVIDETIRTKTEHVSDADRIRAIPLFQQGVKAANFGKGPSMRRNGVTWSFPSLYWGKNQHPDLDRAIREFRAAVSVNPSYHEARVALAFCLLRKKQEEEAYRHLERVLLNSENAILVGIVERLLNARPITPDRLDDISPDPEGLYNALVAGHYIDKADDNLVGIVSVDKAEDIELPAYSMRQREMMVQVIRPQWSPPDRKLLLNGKWYNRESEYHFYLGRQLSQFNYIGRQFGLPTVHHDMDDGTPEQQSTDSLRAAFDEYSTAVYLDASLDAATTYLGYVMRTRAVQQHTHANMWFEYVARNSPDDNWKFLAADAMDRIPETAFSDDFSYLINVNRYLVKKYAGKLKGLSSKHKFSDGGQSAALLRNAYLAALFASCENTLWAEKNKPSHLGRGLRLDIFRELTAQSQTDESAARARAYIVTKLQEKYPRITPYFLKNKLPGRSGITTMQDGAVQSENTSLPPRYAPRRENRTSADRTSNPVRKTALTSLQHNDGNPRTFRGKSVSLYEDYAISGEMLSRVKGWYSSSEAGAATIYRYAGGTWSPVTRLTGDKPIALKAHDWFGASVDIHSEYAIVGAPLDDDKGPLLPDYFPSRGLGEKFQAKGLIEKLFNKGYLNVYGHTTKKFTGLTDGFREDFPELSKNEAYQLVQAVKHSTELKDIGAAYIFRRIGNNWNREGKLFASDVRARMKFGVDVAIHNQQSLVCATGVYRNENTIMSPANTSGGGAYLFRKKQGHWVEESKLITAKCKSVALGDEWAMVGARRPDRPIGTVYAFRKVNGRWNKYQELVPDDIAGKGRSFNAYGSTIDLSGDYVVIGNPLDNLGDANRWVQAGSTYVFKFDGGKWVQTQKLDSRFNAGKLGEFGTAVSFSDNRILVGALDVAGHTGKMQKAGRAYIFRKNGDRWTYVEELSPAIDTAYENFGAAVAIGKRSLLIGAPGPDGHGKLYFQQTDENIKGISRSTD
ncbi:hypothetical protein MNBD_GAMMA14-2429 [hydrothermal vent metagenome]|uniref:Uncharacterized protein n=1 Tax=hydrothermal vent metagenome TaxID=652676 RepID=A0A3B0YHX8_9ZZZZ